MRKLKAPKTPSTKPTSPKTKKPAPTKTLRSPDKIKKEKIRTY